MNPFTVGISFKRYVLYVEIWCENMVLNKDDFLYYFYTHMKLYLLGGYEYDGQIMQT